MGKQVAGIVERSHAAAVKFGSEPLLSLPDRSVVNLAAGYIPLLARLTFEDKAAKGLRKSKAGQRPEPSIHYSALELVRDNRIILLTGPSGGGKTTFAKHLCFKVATSGFQDSPPILRNESGDTREESWGAGDMSPCYLDIDSPELLNTLVEDTLPAMLRQCTGGGSAAQRTLLIVMDGIEVAGSTAPDVLENLVLLFRNSCTARLVLLGEPVACGHLSLPTNVARDELLPLLQIQRKRTVSKLLGPAVEHPVGTGAAAANPALFSLALQARHPGGKAEELLDAWLSAASSTPAAAEAFTRQAYAKLCDDSSAQKLVNDGSCASVGVLSCDLIYQLLAARHLANLTSNAAFALFCGEKRVSQAVTIRSCLRRLRGSDKFDALADQLLGGTISEAQRGALLVADLVPIDSSLHDRIKMLMLAIVTSGSLSVKEREKAGRVLSKLGDPRDLSALAQVSAGSAIMGADSHPNSQPVESIPLEGFRIGLYPVVNKDYLAFVRETGREWLSPDGTDPERQNVPATDLTWHDARAYCSWVTDRWRASGKIDRREQVRLPNEAEWERAARGGRDLYPWGRQWEDDAANGEEAGLGTICSVGLFPRGRSPDGCHDMAGNIWEWCTTLWGEDMSTPFFKYPWRPDEREALNSSETMRRVLRGGCFLSPKTKANCVYRGSLEPSGSWRGNGFRIVVASKDS